MPGKVGFNQAADGSQIIIKIDPIVCVPIACVVETSGPPERVA